MDSTTVRLRTGLFVALLLIINAVQDGPPKLASPFLVQVGLLPVSLVFVALMFRFLRVGAGPGQRGGPVAWLGRPEVDLFFVYLFELGFICLFVVESVYFSAFAYHLRLVPTLLMFGGAVGGLFYVNWGGRRVAPGILLVTFLGVYGVGQILSIVSFPLNYLRSDMMPVIVWADRALLAGGSAYQHFHVADRIYDFPYLPGILVSFLPAEALHLDPRWAAIVYVVGAMALLYWAARGQYKERVAVLIGLFVLSPYLQYRHELYTQAHFLSLVVIFVLMLRGRFAWSAVAFGVSMFLSQFSWVIFPFFLMNGLRRGGWREVARMALLAGATAAALMAPFSLSAGGSIAHNAVGQWDALERAIARPINLAFWVSYGVRPAQLKWVQLALLSGIFCFCWARGRCADLADTLRWMIAALTVFILLNVLIDGYFYLMLLVPMLVYTCVANGWCRPGPEMEAAG